MRLNILFLSLIVIYSCNDNPPKTKVAYTDTDIIGEPTKKTDLIQIDLYIDATTSMEGFVTGPNSKYNQFLNQLEISGKAAWKRSDTPSYFKFGTVIKRINRQDFISAGVDKKFYQEAGVKGTTHIDSVVKNTDTKRLSVLITDLFQTDADVTTMLDNFKNKCFVNDISVGILGIRSEFEGLVFDVPGIKSYGLKKTDAPRPFYAIVFGNNNNIDAFFDVLKTQPFVDENQILIFSKYITESYTAALTKTKESKFVNKKAASTDMPNVFDFSMKEEGKEAKFDLSIDVKRKKRAADFDEKNIEVTAAKISTTGDKGIGRDSAATNDITIENLKKIGDKLTGTVILNNKDAVGNYTYVVYLKANPLSGLKIPKWISDFSTDNPVLGTTSASNTLNLEKLTKNLFQANAAVSPNYIAKFYINIYKR